ncbi:MAG: hypothetical protein CM15mP29_2610 [Alphaproteobacteria bacterium]|nr:MAG: hypothetical protein CM15mP29_2610 [Alphaproteobacteria bacterium]
MLSVFQFMKKIFPKNGKKTGGGKFGGTRIDLGYEKPGGTKKEIKHGIPFSPENCFPLFLKQPLGEEWEIQWKTSKFSG